MPDEPLVGEPLPPLSLTEWLNGAGSLDDFGGKVLVIDFWATWCHPCLADAPRNVRLLETYGEHGLAVLGICATTGSEKMVETARSAGMSYPLARDIDKASERALHVRWFPSHYLIDRDGIVRESRVSMDRVEEAVPDLLAETPA
jgi:cytochrome c biogenesis protein CcmG/thiol:disulfide interchange protein DsbE